MGAAHRGFGTGVVPRCLPGEAGIAGPGSPALSPRCSNRDGRRSTAQGPRGQLRGGCARRL